MDYAKEILSTAANSSIMEQHSLHMEQGSLFFVGTATVLFRYAGFTILTDPNFLHMGEQVNIGYGLHSTRLTEPAMTLEQLPPLDFVMLSHMHEDHFDRVVERELNKLLPIMTESKCRRCSEKKGIFSSVWYKDLEISDSF